MSNALDPTPPPRTPIQIVEVSPRDGLQTESTVVPVPVRLELIRRAVAAGLRRVEVASFVNERRVPQMAGAEELCAGLPEGDDVIYSGLVLNARGCERALDTGRIQEVNATAIASDTFGLKNQGRTAAESIALAQQVLRITRAAGLRPGASLAVAFGCPYEGHVSVQRVVDAAMRLAEAAPVEIALADTAGVGVPHQVQEVFSAVDHALGGEIPLRAHFHDTRNNGMANVFAAIGAGVRVIDASIGGIGGCPTAAGTGGNIATEDLMYVLGEEAPAGVDLASVMDATRWLEGVLDRDLPSMLPRAPVFPPPVV